MTASTVGCSAHDDEPRKSATRNKLRGTKSAKPRSRMVKPSKGDSTTLLRAFLAVISDSGRTYRTIALMSLPLGAAVALAIYLGPIGIATLVTLLGGEGVRRACRLRRGGPTG